MKLLIVEDDPGIAGFLKEGLKEEKFVLDLAMDGEQGEFLAATNHYDLVILDLMLPRRSGSEVCRNLREQGIKTPILMLTAMDATSDKVAGLNSGADDYLTKPFIFEELLARIRALLRRGPSLRDSTLVCTHLTLDTLGHTVHSSGREVELSAREYRLLECLMRNEGKVLTRQQLADQVWGSDYDPLSNVIDVYINYLRNKVDVDPSTRLIHTVRGMGYLFKPKERK